jgi:hypothetical protein
MTFTYITERHESLNSFFSFMKRNILDNCEKEKTPVITSTCHEKQNILFTSSLTVTVITLLHNTFNYIILSSFG